MDRSTIRGLVAGDRFVNTGAYATTLNAMILSAEGWVWAHADWPWKRVDKAALAVTANDATPSLPGPYKEALQVFDEIGVELEALESREFDRRYQPGVTDGQTAHPEAFKIENGVLTLGPTPDASYTFALSYKRGLFHYESAVATAGGMDSDTDTPFIPDEQHQMVIVHRARTLKLAEQNDPSAVTESQLAEQALAAMVEDYIPEQAENVAYGADTLG